jgi:hypothetical protein
MNLQENEEELINDDELETTEEMDIEGEDDNFDDSGNFSGGEDENFDDSGDFSGGQEDFSAGEDEQDFSPKSDSYQTTDLEGHSYNQEYFQPEQKTPSDFRVMRFEDFVSSRSED